MPHMLTPEEISTASSAVLRREIIEREVQMAHLKHKKTVQELSDYTTKLRNQLSIVVKRSTSYMAVPGYKDVDIDLIKI